jgi:hypothetical protein
MDRLTYVWYFPMKAPQTQDSGSGCRAQVQGQPLNIGVFVDQTVRALDPGAFKSPTRLAKLFTVNRFYMMVSNGRDVCFTPPPPPPFCGAFRPGQYDIGRIEDVHFNPWWSAQVRRRLEDVSSTKFFTGISPL